jgi:hypothetical protein
MRYLFIEDINYKTAYYFVIIVFFPWMKEEKGIIHRGREAYLRCPVSTSVQFSLRDEGSTEYIHVCEGGDNWRQYI